jgi:hypothetical protein
MDPFSSISNMGGGAGAIGNQFGGGCQHTGGPQSPKAILQALLAKLGMAQQGGQGGGGGQCSCGGATGGGQSGCSCGCAQRSNGLGF